jgi:hypothetical protein
MNNNNDPGSFFHSDMSVAHIAGNSIMRDVLVQLAQNFMFGLARI